MLFNMNTITIVKCIYTRRPEQSHAGKLCLVSVSGGARMTQIDILLSILAVKVYVMCCLTQMRRVRHAGVSIHNVKTT
jgi:hypothetical protein